MTLRGWIRGITIGLAVCFAMVFALFAVYKSAGGNVLGASAFFGLLGIWYLAPVTVFVLLFLRFADLRRRVKARERWGSALAYTCLSAAVFAGAIGFTYLAIGGYTV